MDQDEFSKIFNFKDSYYSLQIIKVKANRFKLRGCMQTKILLEGCDVSKILCKAKSLREAWHLIEVVIRERLENKRSVQAHELYEDLITLGVQGDYFEVEGKTVWICVGEKEIEARHRFISIKGPRLSEVVLEMRTVLSLHSEALVELDRLKADYIIREADDGRLYYFDGNEEISFEYDFCRKSFPSSCLFKSRGEEEDCGCGVCFVVYLQSLVPRIKCEVCRRRYHKECLGEWFEAEGKCKYLKDRILGQCLYCQRDIFCNKV